LVKTRHQTYIHLSVPALVSCIRGSDSYICHINRKYVLKGRSFWGNKTALIKARRRSGSRVTWYMLRLDTLIQRLGRRSCILGVVPCRNRRRDLFRKLNLFKALLGEELSVWDVCQGQLLVWRQWRAGFLAKLLSFSTQHTFLLDENHS
jgi:hypothetical protein